MNMFKNLMFCFQKVGEEIVFKHLRSTQDFSYTENMCITKLVGSNAYTIWAVRYENKKNANVRKTVAKEVSTQNCTQ